MHILDFSSNLAGNFDYMKKLLWGILCLTITATGCKEDHSLVSLHDAVSVDTTYVLAAGAIPSAEPHNVLIEDFTGVSCSNCPGAHDSYLVPLDSANRGRINIMELFVTDIGQTAPNPGEHYGGFRSSVATQIEAGVYGTHYGMPIAGIDRMPIGAVGTGGEYYRQVISSGWTPGTEARLPITDSLNLAVASTYASATRTATIVVKITYLQPTTTLQNLSIAIVEDSLVDLQEFPSTIAEYHYNGVFRDLVTAAPFGAPIMTSLPLKEAGRVIQQSYSYTVDSSWVAKNCRIIAFVHGNVGVAGGPVYQSVQCPLAP